jgi:flagellar biosynthetic protein FliS
MTTAVVRRAALEAYRGVYFGVDGLDQKRLVLEMLFDGLAASLAGMKSAQIAGDYVLQQTCLARATRIVVGLEKALDASVDQALVDNLGMVYRYILRRLARAQGRMVPSVSDDLLKLVQPLRQAFSGAVAA